MNSAPIALLCALVGVSPLFINRHFKLVPTLFIIYFIIGWPFIYLMAPSTIYPLFGIYGLVVFIWFFVSAMADLVGMENQDYPFPWAIVPPVLVLVCYIVVAITNSAMINSTVYSDMAGTMEERVWTQDIQPKDPKHMLMGSVENALYQADKALGQAGAIGSQFQVAREYTTLQRIGGQWWYVVPLDYSGVSVWWSTDGVPAYIKVSAEDPNRQPILVNIKNNGKMKFTPGAFFGNNIERYMRYHGYLNKGMYELLFEIDEEENPWWVVPIYKPSYGWWGEVITEVAQINPMTGEIKQVKMSEIPAWMDRVFPGSLTRAYQTWRGSYRNGWLNSWLWSKEITEPQRPILIYGANNEPYWVSGITSNNSADNSLVALVYTDARLGKSIRYEVKGGATEDAVVDAVDNNEQVSYKKLHGVNPQLYNVYGTMASVVPLLNASHIFQGVAIVDINNTSQIAVGSDQYEALRHYQRLLSQNGQQVALSNARENKMIKGEVERFGFDQTSGVYYILVKGVSHLFTLDATSRPKLPVTQVGDLVQIEYDDSGETVMPVVSFDNLTIQLQGKKLETEVKTQADGLRQIEEAKADSATTKENLKGQLEKMTPEQLQGLEQQIKSNPSVPVSNN